ncbi:hypothetical protein [Nevskia sp.]|uniref:hypothetical protein n=1 Tax=Nevskia sp. TaxID=1929292 RepID=UPI0025DCE790|nr:hypothetical protein [Nevskia sp.]
MSHAPQAASVGGPPVSRETRDAARVAVRDLLERSDAFKQLSPDKRQALAQGLVQIGSYLAEPDGVRLKPEQQSEPVRALADDGRRLAQKKSPDEDAVPEFRAQAAREGAAVAGALLDQVDFPAFCSGLINGVFHSIVQSSIEQMEAYAKMVADVSKSLNQFRDDNTTQNQGRDHLVEQFPDVFQISVGGDDDFGSFGGGGGGGSGGGPKVTLRDDVDTRAAIEKINRTLPLDKPLEKLDNDVAESILVSAARTQMATSRQQLLATMVLLGINRIVVTDGKLQAKVQYEFQARDNFQYRSSAQKYDYDRELKNTTSQGAYESDRQDSRTGASSSYNKDAGYQSQGATRNASYYAKGEYKNTAQPVITLSKASTTSIDANIQTKAQLAGLMEVNFKSDYLPLEKLANPESIAQIQFNAQPGMTKTLASRPAAPAAAATPPAATP